MSTTQIQKYQERLSSLEDRLHKEQVEEHKKIENLGWGAGMRKTKVSISTTKSDRTLVQIRKVKTRIRALEHLKKMKQLHLL